METILSINLQYTEGSSDKVYNIDLVKNTTGYDVTFAYGRKSTVLTTGKKNSIALTYEKAEKVYNKLIGEKLNKGYKEIGNKATIVQSVVKINSGFKPQLLNEIDESEVEEYILNSNYCAQEKFDGVRRSIIKTSTGIVGTNKKGQEIGLQNDIIDAVKILGESSFILDGEAFDTYIMLFDMVDYASNYAARYKKLEKLIPTQIELPLKVIYTAWDYEQKRKLFEKLKKENAEGIVFKKIDSQYSPGRPNSGGNHLKFKFRATCTCVVESIHSTKRSVSLKMFDDDMNEILVGNATIYANKEIPAVNSFVEIKYLYAYKEGSLFQPVYLGERLDCDTSDCNIKQLKYKQEEDENI